MKFMWSWLRAVALFSFLVFSPTFVSAKNLCPDLTGQVYDPTDDIIVTTYHSHMGASFGGPITWGEDMGSDGNDQTIMNLVIPDNGYDYTGDVLKFTDSGNSGAQGFVLTSDGLWSWGPVNEVVNLRKPGEPTLAIGEMYLPGGVLPADILDIKANSDIFFLLTKNGEVWIAGNNVSHVSGNTDTTANTWQHVETSAGTALTGIVELTGSREMVYARKTDNTIWAWGRGVALGNGATASTEIYAKQVSLAGVPAGVTLSQLGTYLDASTSSAGEDTGGVLALGSDQKLYGLGNNGRGRLIDSTTNFISSWKEITTPVGEAVLFVATSENTEQYPSAAIITTPGGSATNNLYTWGYADSSNIGHSNGLVENPALPSGFIVGTNDPLYASVGGHAMSFAEKANGGQVCFVGHVTNGSTGGLTADPSSFNCVGDNSAGWPPEASFCFQTPPEGNVTGSVQDESGNPLSGVTIQMQDADGNIENDVNGNPLTTVTLADGSYSFLNVITDDYFIVEIDPQDYISVSDGDDTDDSDAHINTNTNDNRIPITVLKDELDADNNFVDILAGNVIGHIYYDVNGNGQQDVGEMDLANVDVNVTDSQGNSQIVTTDANGDYNASSVAKGIASVDIDNTDLPLDAVQTEGTDPTTVNVIGGQDNTEENNGFNKQADLLTTKTVNNATPYVGDTVTYTLRVLNNGAAEATNVSLTDQLPAGITYSGNTLTQGTYSSATGLWNIGTLANGADANLTLSGTVNSGTSLSTITNTTTAALGDEYDPTTGNDDLNESITVLNRDPIAVDDNYTVAEDSNVTLSPLTADGDPDGDLVSITSINGVNLTPGIAQTISVTNGTVNVTTSGVIIFTPSADYNGLVSFPYVITDGNGGVATANENITVNAVNDVPEVDTAIGPQTNEDADTPSVNVSSNFSDPENDTLTYTATGLPNGLTINLNTGVISGTIDKAASQGGTNGVYTVTVTAKDTSNSTVDVSFTWTVTNPVPTATDNNNTTNEDTPVSGNVITDDDGNGVDSDPDGDILSVTQFVVGGSTYTAGQTAALTEGNLTIASTGAYTFTPAANSTANMPQATYTLSDGEGGTYTATLDIKVNATNDDPVANPDMGNTQEDTQLVVAATGILGNDTDLDGGDSLTVTGYNVGGNSASVGNPLVLSEGNLTIAADGSYIFDPADDFNGPVPAVTYTISDNNGGTASSTLTITVDPVNDAPVAEDDSQSTPMNTAVSIPVLNNDHDPEDDSLIILDVNTTGTNGTVAWDENGTVIFTPDVDFVGTTTFTYTISDGNGGTDSATVTITVTDPADPSNNAVTAVADSASTPLDTDVDIPVLINDYDPEGDEFNLTNIVTLAVNGTATINDNGTLADPSDDYVTYEPNVGFVGNDTFEYEITDENGNTDIAIVTVTVVDTATDPLPNAVADAAVTDQDTPVTIDVLDNDTHPNNGEELNITAFTQPANGVVTLDNGGTPNDPSDDQLVYTPNPGFYGNDTFMYTITDSTRDTAFASVTVTVVEKGTVTGIVYEDLNDNGTQDNGEPGLADANMTITDSRGNTYNVTTDVNGSYSQIVPEGNVTIDIDESPYEAIIQTEGTNPTTLFLPAGGTVNDVDGYRAPLGSITVGSPRPPMVDNDDANGSTSAAISIDVIGNDNPGTYPLDPTTVMIIDPVNGEVQSMTVPGEGVWSVDPINGEITFTPASGFIGDPTPIEYTVLDTSGASDTGTITINYPPVANDDSNLSLEEGETAILDVLANDENTSFPLDPERVSLVAPLNATDILSDLDGDIIGFSVPDEGEWIVDETTGVVSFVPEAGIADDPTPVNYTVRETNGDESNEAVLTVSYKRLILTLNAFCENDVPYINYDIQLVGVDPAGQTATITWTSSDGAQTQVDSNLSLSNTHYLWAGAEVDGSGNGIVWPGWNELPDGTWEIIYSDWRRWNPDQNDATVTVTLSVNPSSSVTVQYPPATPLCAANPVPLDSVNPAPPTATGLPQATDNLNVPIITYSPTVIDVLANGDVWGSNGPGNVPISFTQPTHGTVGMDDGGTPNDPTDDVLLYTPKADVNNIKDSFTYTITDAAGNTSTAIVTLDVNCASSQTSDGGDALGMVSMLLLAMMTMMTGLYFVRKEEEKGNLL